MCPGVRPAATERRDPLGEGSISLVPRGMARRLTGDRLNWPSVAPRGRGIAYACQVSISGVGFDIGCGNMAVRLDTPYAAVAGRVSAILTDVRRVVSYGVGRNNAERAEHALFDDDDAWRAADMLACRNKAAGQLGTVGSGNHYVDLMRDKAGFVWIGVHFGSRGLGHTSATKYLKLAGGTGGMNVPPAVVDEDSELGQRYITTMELAGCYAYAGREWVVERVRQIIGGAATDSVHNHHNYAWRETHGCRSAACCWPAATWTRARWPTAACPTCWRSTPARYGCCTPRGRSRWRWPGRRV